MLSWWHLPPPGTDTNAVDLPTDPEELRKMVESIAIVAYASAHAYGKHDGPDITELIDLSSDIPPDVQSDSLSGYCSFDTSNDQIFQPFIVLKLTNPLLEYRK